MEVPAACGRAHLRSRIRWAAPPKQSHASPAQCEAAVGDSDLDWSAGSPEGQSGYSVLVA
jgi:hypothetical protein